MSRPLPDAAASARGTLSPADAGAFDRLAGALLASSSAPLGPLLRAQFPGTAGVRWLHRENVPTATRPTALTEAQWLSLFECWSGVHPAPGSGSAAQRKAGRPATHGHAPGARAVPRWGQ